MGVGKAQPMSTTGTLAGIGSSVLGTGGVGVSGTHQHTYPAAQTTLGMYALSQQEYEFYVEAKNMLSDMANDEELPESYRGQAKRLVARAVLSKL